MENWYGIILLAIYPATAVLGIFIGKLIWRHAERQARKQLRKANIEQNQRWKNLTGRKAVKTKGEFQ